MPKQFVITGGDEDRVRVLDSGALVLHNAHIKSRGRRADSRCKFCSGGVGKLFKELEVRPLPGAGLVQGSGADPKGATTPTSDSGGNGATSGSVPEDSFIQRLLGTAGV